MSENYRVDFYHFNNLVHRVASATHRRPYDVCVKPQIKWLDNYLQKMNAETMVVEQDYVDRDYLDDYVAFHARSFSTYGRFCTRLHFFTSRFTLKTLRAAVDADELGRGRILDFLQRNYLGFTVVRPLPEYFIGRVQLIAPGAGAVASHQLELPFLDKGAMKSAALFGHNLTIPGVVPFQEQDNIVAACATSSLWVMFQMLDIRTASGHPSPSAIEALGSERVQSGRTQLHQVRALSPTNAGLRTTAIEQIVNAVGLRPHVVNVFQKANGGGDPFERLKAHVYAYAKAGVATGVLVTDQYEIPEPNRNEETGETADPPAGRYLGTHAVAMLGFEIPDWPPARGATPRSQRGFGISSIIVNDDQLGPYVGYQFPDKGESFDAVPRTSQQITEFRPTASSTGGGADETTHRTKLPNLHTPWMKEDWARNLQPKWMRGEARNLRHVPQLAVFALPAKVRVEFHKVSSAAGGFEGCLKVLMEAFKKALSRVSSQPEGLQAEEQALYDTVESLAEDQEFIREDWTWDIYLVRSTTLKTELATIPDATFLRPRFEANGDRSHTKSTLLSENWPKYVWRATAYKGDAKLLDLLFDATDLGQTSEMFEMLVYGTSINNLFSRTAKVFVQGIPAEYLDILNRHGFKGHHSRVQKALSMYQEQRQDYQLLFERKYGPVESPTTVKPCETSENGLVKQQPIQALLIFPSEAADRDAVPQGRLPLLDVPRDEANDQYYIWIIDEEGRIIIGQELDDGDGALGHPTLVGGLRARIAGELYCKDVSGKRKWVMSSKSGRYTNFKERRTKEELENAASRLKDCFKDYQFEILDRFQSWCRDHSESLDEDEYNARRKALVESFSHDVETEVPHYISDEVMNTVSQVRDFISGLSDDWSEAKDTCHNVTDSAGPLAEQIAFDYLREILGGSSEPDQIVHADIESLTESAMRNANRTCYFLTSLWRVPRSRSLSQGEQDRARVVTMIRQLEKWLCDAQDCLVREGRKGTSPFAPIEEFADVLARTLVALSGASNLPISSEGVMDSLKTYVVRRLDDTIATIERIRSDI